MAPGVLVLSTHCLEIKSDIWTDYVVKYWIIAINNINEITPIAHIFNIWNDYSIWGLMCRIPVKYLQ